jgi:hypothetical protein
LANSSQMVGPTSFLRSTDSCVSPYMRGGGAAYRPQGNDFSADGGSTECTSATAVCQHAPPTDHHASLACSLPCLTPVVLPVVSPRWPPPPVSASPWPAGVRMPWPAPGPSSGPIAARPPAAPMPMDPSSSAAAAAAAAGNGSGNGGGVYGSPGPFGAPGQYYGPPPPGHDGAVPATPLGSVGPGDTSAYYPSSYNVSTPRGAAGDRSGATPTRRRRSSFSSVPGSPGSGSAAPTPLRRANLAETSRMMRAAHYAAPPPKNKTYAGEANR